MNSTIFAWQLLSWDTLIVVIMVPILTLMIANCVMLFRAADNPKNLRKSKYVAWDIFAIPLETYIKENVMILVVDIDRTLCKLSLRWWRAEKRLPLRSVNYLKWLHKKLGIKIVLATKSNENVHEMIRTQFNGEPWIMGIMTSKSSPDFLGKIFNIAHRCGWHFDSNSNRVMLVGDKATDMGFDDENTNYLVVPILTNPQGGHDNIGEYLILRRGRERLLLSAMNIKRASEPNEFRLAT